MKKFGLLVILIIMGSLCKLHSQTFVVTTPQLRNVVLEEFTGIHCGYCPDGHYRATLLSEDNPGRVVLINIHAGGYAKPDTTKGEPDFRTEFGEAIDDLAGVSGYPAGSVNRHIFPGMSGNGSAMSRSYWDEAADEILPQPSIVNVGFESQFDSATRILTVNAEIYYTGNSPNSNNYINVALLENHVFGWQTDYGNGNNPNYDHKHILRHFLTGQWGDTITSTYKGSFISKTYTYTVPEEYNIKNCDIAVYVTESKEEIYTGVKDVADGGSHDGSSVIYIGDLKAPTNIVKEGINSQTSSFDIELTSALSGTEDFVVSLISDQPSDWNSMYTYDGVDYNSDDTFNLSSATPETFTIKVIPGATPEVSNYKLSVSSVNNPEAPARETVVYVFSGITDLIVNHDAPWGDQSDTSAEVFEQAFIDGLTYAGVSSFTTSETDFILKANKAGVLSGINNIYFNVGWSFPSLTDDNVAALTDFLDNGGNLLISGQDIGWETWNTDRPYGTTITKDFYNKYMFAGWIDDGSTSNNMLYSKDDPIFNNIGNSGIINMYGSNPSDGTHYMYPDQLNTAYGGVPILYYDQNNTKIAAVRGENANYKSVYLGVSLEMIADENFRKEIMKLSYLWFEGIISSDEFDDQLKDNSMTYNYPNPCDNKTIIAFNKNEEGLGLQLLDMNGKVILEKAIQPGIKEYILNTSDISSGFYLYRILDKDKTLISKSIQVIH